MTNIINHAGATDSLKKQFVTDFNVAFAKGDMEYVLNCFSDNILWDVVNHEPVRGKSAVKAMLSEMNEVADELVIDRIVCDGDACAINGMLTYDGNAIAFSDTYIFDENSNELRINTLIGFAIELAKTK